MLVGYMRVSKADGSQVTDLQRDAFSPPASMPGTSTRTPPPTSAMIAPDWPPAPTSPQSIPRLPERASHRRRRESGWYLRQWIAD
jgi:hypothetical protein